MLISLLAVEVYKLSLSDSSGFCPLLTQDFYPYKSQIAKMNLTEQGFFSKFLMGGGLKIFGPRRSPTGTKSDGGGLAKKI